jgi:hypothetical protein
LKPGEGFEARRALLYYAQRFVTAPRVRRAASDLIAAGLRRRHGDGDAWPQDDVCREALATLRRDGVAMLPPLVSDEQITAMADYFRRRPVIAGGQLTSLDALPAGAPAAAYTLDTVLACPGMPGLLNAPRSLRIAADYLGCKPTLSSVGVRWTFPGAAGSAGFQSFHRDVDDWRFIKVFVYLNPVDEGCGPHMYVRGSHLTGFGLTARPYEASELRARYGDESLLTVTGPPGTTFVADTLGIHRGGRPSERPRLMLQIQYSLLPVFAFRYEPVSNAAPAIDPYCNRLIMKEQLAGA